MSLTSILKEIDRVNSKQIEVEKRYNRRSKGCLRQEDLRREEQEDHHIFGYSHTQMLAMFHQTKGSDFDNTRPCTAADAHTVVEDNRPQTALNLRHAQTRPGTEMQRPAMRRAQSAVKLGSYRQQFNFLFKEDIFDQNHEKMRRTQPLREQNSESNQRKMSKMLVERTVPRTVSKMHSKSIKAERVNFVKSFDENVARMQGAKRKKLQKVSKNQIFYSRSTFQGAPEKGQQREQPQDFFRLTKAADRQQPKKIKVVLSSSLDNLKELQCLINQPQSDQLAEFIRESSVGRYSSLLDTNFITYLPSKFTLTCVINDNLQSVRLRLAVRSSNTLSLEDSREILNLANVFEQLLSSHSMVHLTFHSEGTLLYQETLVAQPYRKMQSKEHEILLLMYYLKRFLLFDEKATLRSVCESADLLLKSNIDLPDDFADFTETFGGKLCRVYDTDQRLYQFALGPALANGLASVTAFKKEMGLGQKVVKLKQGTREQFKKYLYNWEYFYICPSL